MIKKFLLTLALTLISAGAALAENAPLPEAVKPAPAVAAAATEACAHLDQESPLFTATVPQRIATCGTECRDEFIACRATCTNRTCLGECADALDICQANC